MKITKALTAMAAAAALAATTTVTASAATYKDCVEAAKEAGVQSWNVEQLEGFLEKHDPHGHWSSEDYDDMIETLNGVRDDYVTDLAKQMFDKEPGELTDEEKILLGNQWSEEDKQDIQNRLIDLGKKYDTTITITQKSKSHYDVAATISEPDDSTSTSSQTTSSKTVDSQVKDNPVAKTGGELKDDGNSAVLAFGGIATILAAAGIVIVARKNKG